MPGTMIILRGITNLKVWPKYHNGALDEPPAVEYAKRRGYTGRVLDVSGETGDNSPQTKMALQELSQHRDINGIYGFSGGGYNVYHIIKQLAPEIRGRLELLVVIGVETKWLTEQALDAKKFNAKWDLVYRNDPPAPLGHIDGPRYLLSTAVIT